jgi:hypothetical protein
MPNRSYTKFWQNTCTAWLLKGPKTLIKLDLPNFMHFVFDRGVKGPRPFDQVRIDGPGSSPSSGSGGHGAKP